MAYDENGALTCDMWFKCQEEVTHIDQDGYVYCTDHGLQRRMSQPCRKLRTWELNRLKSGKPLKRY